MNPADRRYLWAGLAVSAVVLAIIVVAQLRGPTAHPAPYGPGPLAVVPGADCSAERVELACERWASAGWPRCEVAAGQLDVVRVVDADLPAGAAGGMAVDVGEGRSVAVASCAPDRYDLEHELGHAVHGLADDGLTGSVMCSRASPLDPTDGMGGLAWEPADRCIGTRIPRAP